MKTNLLKNAVALAIVMTTCFNCSVEEIDNSEVNLITEQTTNIVEQQEAVTCNGSNPKSRITNNGTIPLDLEIFDASGNLIDGAYGVQPSSTSSWLSFPEGTTIFNVTINNIQDQKVGFNMETCTELDMIVDVNHVLVGTSPQASVD